MVKSQPYLDSFKNTYSKWKQTPDYVYTLNGTVWYPFCPVWLNLSCFRDEIFSYDSYVNPVRTCNQNHEYTLHDSIFILVQGSYKSNDKDLANILEGFLPRHIIWWQELVLGISHWYLQVVKSQPYLNSFRTLTSKWKQTSDYKLHTINGTVWYLFFYSWVIYCC